MSSRVRRSSLSKAVKLIFLRTCEFLGLFHVSAWAFRKRLHILCYHGFELQDECAFRPQLFISPTTFEGRLRHIAKRGFAVLPLSEALERLRSGGLPKRAVVITIDDGFKSTLSVASPLLRKFGVPATVYVTTYYMDKQVPIFRLGIQYVFWKARGRIADLSRLSALVGGRASPDLWIDAATGMWALIGYGEALGTEQERQELLVRVAQELDVDLSPLSERYLLSIMSADELRTLRSRGIDVQLHTHRHRFPSTDRTVACREIEENRIRLKEAVGVTARHFCYPSGLFDTVQWPWLEALGIESATTCLPGLNRSDTPLYGLKRFLDNESIECIEFRAELAGFSEILRYLRKVLSFGRREVVSATD
jgi:peptidoglycan/xylan/chitin deacetylase (PgdA/CDA1 family)